MCIYSNQDLFPPKLNHTPSLWHCICGGLPWFLFDSRNPVLMSQYKIYSRQAIKHCYLWRDPISPSWNDLANTRSTSHSQNGHRQTGTFPYCHISDSEHNNFIRFQIIADLTDLPSPHSLTFWITIATLSFYTTLCKWSSITAMVVPCGRSVFNPVTGTCSEELTWHVSGNFSSHLCSQVCTPLTLNSAPYAGWHKVHRWKCETHKSICQDLLRHLRLQGVKLWMVIYISWYYFLTKIDPCCHIFNIFCHDTLQVLLACNHF